MDIEQAILSGIMVDPTVLNEISLTPDDFIDPLNAVIFSAMRELEVVDLVTVCKKVPDQVVYISGLLDISVTSANVPHYASLLKEESVRRKVSKSLVSGGNLAALAAQLLDVTGEDKGKIIKASDVLDEVISDMEAEIPEGIYTGLRALDNQMGTLRPHNLIVIAGRPGMGKSALALSLMYNMGKGGKPSLMFSTEMSAKEQVARQVCFEHNASLSDVTLKIDFDEEYPKVCKGAGIVSGMPMYFDHTGGISVEELMSRATKTVDRLGISAIFVDYINQMVSKRKTDNRNAEVGYISMMLKALAKRLNLPVIALCQVNRKCEERSNKRPQLSDLRDSGEIEQNADKVIFTYRPQVYDRHSDAPSELIIAKNKQGKTGTVDVVFLSDSMRFVDLHR